MKYWIRFVVLTGAFFISATSFAQQIKWAKDGISYYRIEGGEIVKYSLPQNSKTVVVAKTKLQVTGQSKTIGIRKFIFSENEQQVLIYTNSKKVWRLDTRGDYWWLNMADGSLRQIGKSMPASSLMFAKFSPDGS